MDVEDDDGTASLAFDHNEDPAGLYGSELNYNTIISVLPAYDVDHSVFQRRLMDVNGINLIYICAEVPADICVFVSDSTDIEVTADPDEDCENDEDIFFQDFDNHTENYTLLLLRK